MPILRRVSYTTEANDQEIQSRYRRINKKIDILDKKMDGLYKDIYISRPDDRNNLDHITDRLDTAIDRLQNSSNDISGTSELLRRIDLQNTPNTNKYLDSVRDLFSDQSVLNSLFSNENIHKYIAGQNYQFDLICKYLPKLRDALDIKKDAVLCSDNFSKDFLNAVSAISNKEDKAAFDANTRILEKKYNIQDFVDKCYDKCSIYGEDFVYHVPYTEAFKRLIKRSNRRRTGSHLGQLSFYEVYQTSQVDTVVREGYTDSREFKDTLSSVSTTESEVEFDKSFKGSKVNLYFNDSGIIINSVQDMAIVSEQTSNIFKSLHSVRESSLQQQYEKIKDNDLTRQAGGVPADGLIIPGDLNRDPNKIDKKMNGAVLESLPRENTIPVYIGKLCVGYYYLEFAEDPHACGFCGGHHMTPGISNSRSMDIENSIDQEELAIRFIANRISQSIDTHFINANKDLKEEIYQILRYNENFEIRRTNDIGVTFIPAEDVTHCYFKLDEHTHRGISDLEKSLIPAMLYILLYLTDIIGKITRSTDKRVYYVKQNVETNVARTMMNVVAQIKKGNMGMRQIESMNNILNVVGKYNDYIIPMGQSGDPPIQFEVMQGQEINTPTDIMEKMEELAVNATGTPLEMVNSTLQQDFAIRYTMSNTRFLKAIYKRQRIVQEFVSKIYTNLYNYEFGENYQEIPIILPPPTYLTATNNQQLFDNQAAMADKIIEIHMQNKTEEEKMEFKNIYIRNTLSTYMNYNEIDRMIEQSTVNVEVNKKAGAEDGGNTDEYY